MPQDNQAQDSKVAPPVLASPDRQSMPIDREQAPRMPFPVVGIGASAGGLEAVTEFLSSVRPDSGMAYVFIQHLPPSGESMLSDILSKRSPIQVRQVDDGMDVEANQLYVIRPGFTLTIKDKKLHLGERLSKPMNHRPVDDFFKSLAEEQRERAIAIILSGMGSNGTAGAQAIKAVGGLCIAQDTETAEFPSMPRHLIDAGYADYILTPKEMPDALLAYAGHPYASGGREEKSLLAKRDQQHLREILAVLRTRTRQDFNGYKKPTVFRRVQRRMGLNHMIRLSEYAKLLRQSNAEVSSLADDLLIHVTGFFRDPEAWEALRKEVVVPLISSRQEDEPIRCWVTACSSGEEAYTLAMVLVEEAERLNRPLDIKIFATDMAERTLKNARSGIYPGGIEAEIEPSRLERFFQREDAVYRVRQELRERVIFAPQNVLQDPPFSRMDIVTCRNLLIYLEPEVQQRIMALLHFGLREGGALFLGTSETVGSDDLFAPLDKKARIYRRVGPTRHGSVEFPVPRVSIGAGKRSEEKTPRPQAARPSLNQMTNFALLEHHTPAAVTIDRDYRIVYFHGDTEPFISSPRGEPTRDLMSLVHSNLRGAVRTAVQRAAAKNETVTVQDGWIEKEQGHHIRVAVTVSPLDLKNSPEYFVVSFQERDDRSSHEASPEHNGDNNEELRRIRDELQSTIEELQTSNEELKASHEEVVSANEELQSTNEELETSREEMQSLNEELSTVNSQLHAKMEEHLAVSNDLSSLLTSTDLAVLFLDSRFRIRRFTPKIRELIDLIGSDIGRPVTDFARKFTDPELTNDIESVLTKLLPISREVTAEGGLWYLRRITPYRTTDNRIDGVVITFVDITDRKQAQGALLESEERLRLLVEGAVEFAMILLDPSGRITAWNSGAERLLGYSQKEAIGMEASIIFTPEDRAVGAPESEMEEARLHGAAKDERWHLRRNGTRFWGSGVLTAIRPPDGTLTGFVKVMRDETSRKKTEDALQIAKDHAEAANQAKDEFLATLSHELRTPLSAMLLWTKLLLSPGYNEKAQLREGLLAIHSSAEAQKELIEDLLDLSRIARGEMRLRVRECEPVAVVQDAVDSIVAVARSKQITLSAELDPNVGTVTADPDRLWQIVSNLLTNAVKFTPAGGRVDITLRRTDETVELRVADTGKGISPEFFPHIFQRFSQADASHSRAFGGMGLGLAIVKRLVELHGGTITAESEGVNKGAVFSAQFPMPAIKKKTARAPVAKAGTARKPAEGAPSSNGELLNGLRLLLVEDNDETRIAIATVLRQSGIQVTDVDSAAAAMESFQQSRPDVIISDIGLPGEDGYVLIRRIRSQETTAGTAPVPALALTAFARDTDHRMAIDAGYQQHLGKPIEPEFLLDTLRELMQKSQEAVRPR